MEQLQGAALLATGIFIGMALSQVDLGARSPKRDVQTGRVTPDLNEIDEFETKDFAVRIPPNHLDDVGYIPR